MGGGMCGGGMGGAGMGGGAMGGGGMGGGMGGAMGGGGMPGCGNGMQMGMGVMNGNSMGAMGGMGPGGGGMHACDGAFNPLNGSNVGHQGMPRSASGGESARSNPPPVISGKPVDGVPDWAGYTAPDGRTYYYNAKTGVSSWEKPTPTSM